MLSCFSCVRLLVTPRTVARQALLSMEFSGQEYWRKNTFPPPEDLPDPGIKAESLVSPAPAGRFFFFSPKQVDSLPPRHQGSWIHIYTLYNYIKEKSQWSSDISLSIHPRNVQELLRNASQTQQTFWDWNQTKFTLATVCTAASTTCFTKMSIS